MHQRPVEWHADSEAVFEYEADLFPDFEILYPDILPMLVGYPVSINGLPIDDAIMYTVTGKELFISSPDELPNVGMIVEMIYETERGDDAQYHHRFKDPLEITRYIAPGETYLCESSPSSEISNHYHILINKVTIDPQRGFIN